MYPLKPQLDPKVPNKIEHHPTRFRVPEQQHSQAARHANSQTNPKTYFYPSLVKQIIHRENSSQTRSRSHQVQILHFVAREVLGDVFMQRGYGYCYHDVDCFQEAENHRHGDFYGWEVWGV